MKKRDPRGGGGGFGGKKKELDRTLALPGEGKKKRRGGGSGSFQGGLLRVESRNVLGLTSGTGRGPSLQKSLLAAQGKTTSKWGGTAKTSELSN